MSIRLAGVRLFKHARLFAFKIQGRTIATHSEIKTNSARSATLSTRQLRPSLIQNVTSQARRVVVDSVLNRVTYGVANDLRKRVEKQLFYGDSFPFLALVGVSLASGPGVLNKDNELEGVCWEIRNAMRRSLDKQTRSSIDANRVGLNSLDFGSQQLLIGKGCNGVIYAARWKDVKSNNMASTSSNKFSLLEYPLAVKMMFNYEAESNAYSILRKMHRETVPAWSYHADVTNLLEPNFSVMSTLPPHANIVEMYRVFTDNVPSFTDCMSLYPDALPSRINPDGFGRNMSLFLVMKRYENTLKKYLEEHKPQGRHSLLLFTQLLEAIVHMVNHNVAHRDLKSDNILLDCSNDYDSEKDCPLLAVTDFGSCIADPSNGLKMPFHTIETERGGNAALMAPEVACAVPGPFTTINYSKADLWTAATLAYELYGEENPFSGSKKLLNNRTYKAEELPKLPAQVPGVVKALIFDLLAVNPKQRPSSELAANICQIILWAPSDWLQGSTPSNSEILQWLLSLTTKVLCEGGYYGRGRRTICEYQLISSFLTRASLHKIRIALNYIQENLHYK